MDNEHNEPVITEDLGDGLFRNGFELWCVYPLISVVRTDNSYTYEYENFYIVISADGTGSERHNIHWERQYKTNGGADE